MMVVAGFALLLRYPVEAAAAVRDGLRVSGSSVIPALFPFFVLTKFLLNLKAPSAPPRWLDRLMRRCFGVSGACGTALALSFLGGYPVGAATVVSLYESGALEKSEAERALRFCNNSGPAFFVGVVGGVVLQDVRLGLLCYAAHILAALCCGLFFAGAKTRLHAIRRVQPSRIPAGKAFLDAISASCAALLQISGLILFFSVVSALLDCCGLTAMLLRLPLPGSEAERRALLCGILEMSGGVVSLTGTTHAAELAAFLLGWGGLCVHLQAASLWHPAGLHPRYYSGAKLLHGLLSALLLRLFLAPTAALAALAAGTAAICIFFPLFRQKWAGNLTSSAV